MQLLITGGLGFIGSNLVRYILKHHPEYKVINLDAETYAGHRENLADLEGDARYNFVKGRIEDKAVVEEIVSGKKFGRIDGIINAAAETHVDRSITDPDVFVHTNVLGTQNLLEAAYRHGLRREGGPIRFVQVSTDEVYGSLGPEGYFVEDTPLTPSSPYSASKAGADMVCRAYFHTYGLPVMITRCSNNYGPYQHPEKLIPLFIMNALQDKPVPVYGDGLNVRDWLHVEDHCQAIDLAFHKGVAGEVYNVGGHNERRNIEITKLILKELGKNESLIKYVEDRLGHDKRYAIDATKLRTELGWKPEHNFESGIHQTIQWYLDNKKWLEAVTSHTKGCDNSNFASCGELTGARGK
ncbi:MAG: dTDP-glucose 4,6-dehydratase [Candidatus Obscuribacterales bacterium]|nr:dTDP-glucose 4,6-dehydratase [Candidatus Obscuribacterales bacterium]